jgi:hypothetical protein
VLPEPIKARQLASILTEGTSLCKVPSETPMVVPFVGPEPIEAPQSASVVTEGNLLCGVPSVISVVVPPLGNRPRPGGWHLC